MPHYITHPLIKPKTIEYREYQNTISNQALDKNLIAILPTGLGKTLIAVLTAAKLLEREKTKKVLILAPSKPLCSQHKETFKDILKIDPNQIVLVTGEIKPENRGAIYEDAKIIIATPQTIRNDIKKGRISLGEFQLIVFDECHRTVKDYSYVEIASEYMKKASNPRILGLTASPGSSKKKIEEVCNNLFIDAVQIRDREDKDVKPYVQQVEMKREYVELPKELQTIKQILEDHYDQRLRYLEEKGLIPSTKVPRRLLVSLQEKISHSLKSKHTNPFLYTIASKNAAALKIAHAIELLETQGIMPLHEYFQKLKKDKTKAAQRLVEDKEFSKAIKLTKELYEKGVTHPKLPKLFQILKKELRLNPNSRIIVFARYRDSIEQILNLLREKGINAERLIGQQGGLTQKEQVKVLNEFRKGGFNILIATAVGEEGIDIPTCSLAVFYDAVPSEIRKIQRSGRTGRTAPGKVVFLITKNTRDEAYFWSAYHKEKRMKKTLRKYQERGIPMKEQRDLREFS